MARRVPLLLLSLLLLAASCAAQVDGPHFQCNAAAEAKCEALASYVPGNDTTYDAIKSLFGVKSLHALLGANNVTASARASTKIPANQLIKVPFTCACANGTGVSDKRPVYTVVKGDTLYNIATQIYKKLLIYQQIVAKNNIKNESLIEIGQQLWIPLPCSCDPVSGAEAVHLAHVVTEGSTLTSIADQFGTSAETLAQSNNITDPKSLKADQVLDVPLRACNSSIRSDSPDAALRVPAGSYALTARNCVTCSCSSSSWQLQCEMANLTSTSTCGKATCSAVNSSVGGMVLGSAISTACGSTRCDYAGYNSSAVFTTVVTNQSACGGPTAPGTPDSGARALWGPSRWTTQLLLLVPLYTALVLLAFL